MSNEQDTSAAQQPTPTGEHGKADDNFAAGINLDDVESDMVEEGAPLYPDADIEQARAALAERTLDLQRLQAEYVNYKRRVDRDRELIRDNAVIGVLNNLLPVLDDLDRARDAGELDGGFKAVAESLLKIVGDLGLVKYGAKGDEFDPNVHEALMHGNSADVEITQVDVVAQPGYRVDERVIRAAKVTVIGPE
ncbi:MAG TPA: nucleotide exchange factor GrpE [Marmoricola sp.]|nr:nucleotide exchange factor GrpE [Nocardioidaceae bacterium]MCO5324915.1 nucleotide exchange factor GrpE [Nocardioidaceae bacterium]HRV68351.1 nucleotide exchange factor GrpE [Marmoricola sp.]